MSNEGAMDAQPHDRVLLVGDTHANPRWTAFVIDQAAKLEVDLVLQLGDFGYWPRHEPGQRFLDTVEAVLADYDLPLWFIDGNHEDHLRLRSAELEPGLRPISPHVSYLPRGTRWDWEATTWLAAGGASSVDRKWRSQGIDWFPLEFMTPEQLLAAASGPADVVLAHDAPSGVRFIDQWYRQKDPLPTQRWPADALADSAAHQQRLRDLLDAVRPRVWFHGHHHVVYHETLATDHGPTSVYGLDCDGASLTEAALLVDGTGTVLPWAALINQAPSQDAAGRHSRN